MGLIEVVEGTKSLLGEGPVWLEEDGVYYWLDIIGKQIRFYRPADQTQWSIETPKYIGAAVPAGRGIARLQGTAAREGQGRQEQEEREGQEEQEGGEGKKERQEEQEDKEEHEEPESREAGDRRLICAMGRGFYELELATGTYTEIALVEGHLPDNRFNDGKCDQAGRFWAGTMSMTGEPGAGALYCLERDGTVQKAVSGISCSNGLGWSADDGVMYYIDTPTREIHQFRYDAETGDIADRRAIIAIADGEGVPDGMTVDAEGMIWVAHWGGWCITRWNPDTGEQLEKVLLPVSQVTSCCFGGEQLDELWITSARVDHDERQLAEEPLAGCCFRYKPGVRGLSVRRYTG